MFFYSVRLLLTEAGLLGEDCCLFAIPESSAGSPPAWDTSWGCRESPAFPLADMTEATAVCLFFLPFLLFFFLEELFLLFFGALNSSCCCEI